MGVNIRVKKKSDGRFGLYLDVYHKGQRVWENLNLTVSKDYTKLKNVAGIDKPAWNRAQLRKAEIEHDLLTTPAIALQNNKCFVEYMKSFDPGHPVTTSINAFVKWHGSDTVPFDDVTDSLLADYLDGLYERGIKPSTAKNYIGHIRAYWNKAVEDGRARHNPFKGLAFKTVRETSVKYLTLVEFEKVRDLDISDLNIRQVVKDSFLFSCYTGLRYSDIRRLKQEDIKAGRLTLTQKKTGRLVSFELPSPAIDILKRYDSDPVFPCSLCDQAFKDQVSKIGKVCGFHLFFHMARHTFATMALIKGVDLYTVSKLLGHCNIKQTEMYAKVVDARRDEAVRKVWG